MSYSVKNQKLPMRDSRLYDFCVKLLNRKGFQFDNEVVFLQMPLALETEEEKQEYNMLLDSYLHERRS